MTDISNASKLGRDFIRQFRGFVELVKELDHINDLSEQKSQIVDETRKVVQHRDTIKEEIKSTQDKLDNTKKLLKACENDATDIIKYANDKAATLIREAEQQAKSTLDSATEAVAALEIDIKELKHSYATEQRRLNDKTIAMQKAYDEISEKVDELRSRLNG